MARHSAQQETEQPLPTPKSPSRLVRFIRSGAFIWVVELLILVAIGIAVYNDWDAPIRDLAPLPGLYVPVYNQQQEMHRHYTASGKLVYFTVYAAFTFIIAAIIASGRRQRELRGRMTQLNSFISFWHSSGVVWLVWFLFMVVVWMAAYGDWAKPIREQFFPPTSAGVESYYLDPNGPYALWKKTMPVMLVGCVTFLIALYIAEKLNRRKLRERIASLADRQTPMRAEEFLATRDRLLAARMLSEAEFTGVYILHNVTKDMYYVGQSIRVLSRATQHFTGHGNGDVYADFKYGDEFTVSTIPMQGSGYQSLNDLERDTIAAYDAQTKGYNMTQGNMR